MKKSLFYWAFLAFVGMSLTACSSGDDNIADNTTPATPDSQNRKVILTGTIGVGDNDETRAITNAGVSSWSADDPITINYETTTSGVYKRTTGTIKTVDSDSHFATFEATLDADAKDDGYIGFAYGTVTSKSTYSSAYDFAFNYSAYATQNGATTGTNSISANRLDFACTESGGQIKMKVDGNTATLKGNALLKNQFSMLKINLVDKDDTDNPVNATELKITIATGENFATPKTTYTITPSSATNEFYVALQPKENGDKVKIVASFNNQDPAIKLDTDAKVNAIDDDDYGKLLCVYTSDANKQAYLCSSSTSPKICEYTYGTDTQFLKGKLYSNQLNVKTLTPTAVIAYTGSVSNYCTKFIALALEDVIPATVTLATAQSTIGSSTWVSDHKLKISNQTYDQFQGETTEGVKGKYDEVFSNKYDATYHMTTSESSKTRTSSLLKGWRIPSVTDFRYIFSQLKDDSNNDVIDQTKISPTSPAGIGDHNVNYHADLTNQMYRTGSTQLQVYINKLCGTDDVYDTNKLQPEYYWLSSQLLDYSVDSDDDGINDSAPISPVAGKAWRYSFSHDYFVWNEANDKSRARLVFAY